jgi:PAS domain S-box-containing protein
MGGPDGTATVEDQLMAIIDQLPTVSFVDRCDPDGRLHTVSLSDEFRKLMGLDDEQARGLRGVDALGLVHPDDVRPLEEAVREHRGTSEPFSVVFRLRDGTGAWRWLSSNVVWFRAGVDEYFYLVLSDVTSIKEEEEQIRGRFLAQQSFLDSVSDSFLATMRVNVTRDVVELAGGRRPLVDMSAGRVGYGDLRAAVELSMPVADDRASAEGLFSRASLLAAFGRGTSQVSLDCRFRSDPDASPRWARFSMNLLLRPETGDVVGFATISDVDDEKTEQRILECMTNAEEYDFVALIDMASHAITFRRITDASMAPVTGIPYDYDEMIHANARRYYADADEGDRAAHGTSIEEIGAHLAHELYYSCTFTVRQPDGTNRWKLMRYRYLDDGRDVVLAVRRDITEVYLREQADRRRLEEALAAARTANAAKSDFLSRMSHDIRTPLNGILGMTALALDEPDRELERHYLRRIDESGRFLLSLVNDILDLSKAESGRMELHLGHYTYPEFIASIESVIRPLCDEKDVSLTVVNPFTGYSILVDPLRINQVFFNLLSNAVKFTPRGGHVRFELANHRLSEGRLSIDFIVSDDGIGMAEEFQSHLFEPFSQERTAANQTRSGTGLGLAITREIVDLMGGTISVASAPGEGTTITTHLSFAVCPDVELAEEPPAPVSLDGVRVLLAEDNAINAEIAMRLLEKRGASVAVATDGGKAVDLFASSDQYHYDVVLMDVRMPVLDGLGATRRIRALGRPDARTVPIVAMTANAFAEDVEECLAAGMDAHVAKPVDPAALFDAIERVLGGRR